MRIPALLLLWAAGWLATAAAVNAANQPIESPLERSPSRTQPYGPIGTPPEVDGERAAPAMSGNPLWAIPVQTLMETRNRPLFRSTRRPEVIVTPVREEPPVAKAAPVETPPPPPDLKLVGTITNTPERMAIFAGKGTPAIIRLRLGEGHQGWVLKSVDDRGAVLEMKGRTVVVEFPEPAQRGSK